MEDFQRNQVIDLSSVSGTLHIIIDSQRHCHKFKNHVKVWVEVNDGFDTSGKCEDARIILENSINNDIVRNISDPHFLVDSEKLKSNPSHENHPEYKTRLFAKSNCDIEKLEPRKVDQLTCKRLKNNKAKRNAKHLIPTTCSEQTTSEKCHGTGNESDEGVELGFERKESGFETDPPKRNKKGKIEKPESKSEIYCEYCSGYFKTQQEFYNHRKSRREEHKCDICQKIFQFKAHLLVHMHSHNGDNGAISEGFIAKAHAEDGLKHPMPEKCIDLKQVKSSFTCELCGAVMSNSLTFKTHMMQHTGENAYQCCVCGKNFNSIGRFSYHLTTHRRVGKVFCKICNIGFESRTDLCKHQLTHRYRCSLCNSVFPNKTSRNFHYKLSHVDDILKCPQCDKLYSSDSELQSHIKYHQNRKKTQCTICGRLVSRLNDHMLSHLSLKAQEAFYVCDQCPKQFRNKLSFQRHLRTHSKEKLYACTQCPKSFGRSTSLSRHMITHTQQKPHVCSICGKACTQMCNLKTHMQIHKESSGFQCCRLCGETFSDMTSIQEHSKNVHGLEDTFS